MVKINQGSKPGLPKKHKDSFSSKSIRCNCQWPPAMSPMHTIMVPPLELSVAVTSARPKIFITVQKTLDGLYHGCSRAHPYRPRSSVCLVPVNSRVQPLATAMATATAHTNAKVVRQPACSMQNEAVRTAPSWRQTLWGRTACRTASADPALKHDHAIIVRWRGLTKRHCCPPSV